MSGIITTTVTILVDPFAEKSKERKGQLKKQKMNELANQRRTNRLINKDLGKDPDLNRKGTFRTGGIKRKRDELDDALSIARRSTASMGKFDAELNGEKPLRKRRKKV